jgi:sugar phosphate isomerase/epimerase
MTLLTQFARAALLTLIGACVAQAATAAAPAPHIGIQLWSVKDEIKTDFEGTLSKIAQAGFEGVEFAGVFGKYENDAPGLKAFMDKTNLKCAGAHVHFDALEADKFDATTAFYKTLGCRNLVISMDKRGASTTESAEMAKQLTAISAKLKPLGLRTGYHNHTQEMVGEFGKTPWDVLAKNTPKESVMQQDVGWTTHAGKDPIAYVKKYPGRTYSTHFKAKFKDGDTGTPIIGMDRTDWAGLSKAVRSVGGTEWIIIEQEEYPNGMGQLESATASLKGLQAVLAKQSPKHAAK